MKIDQGYWKGWEVFIRDNDDNPLPEYQIVHSSPAHKTSGTVHMFVECQDDQIFSIATRRPDGAVITARMHCKVDGRTLWGVLNLPGKDSVASRGHTYESAHGITYECPLKFGKLAVAENGPALNAEEIASLGTIHVNLQSGYAVSTGLSTGPVTAAARSLVDERTKKGMLGSFVSSGPPRPSKFQHTCRFTKDGMTPEYDLYISYRTRPSLMAMGIVNPPPVEPNNDGEDDGDHKPIKRKHKGEGSARKRVKRETEVIDLTRGDGCVRPKGLKIEGVVDLTGNDSDDDS